MMRGSGSSVTPNFSSTDAITRRASASSCEPVAWPRLTSTNACCAEMPASPFAVAAPAGLLDEPRGGELALALADGGEHGQPCKAGLQLCGNLTPDHWVLEEAACITRDRRVGQLAATDAAHRCGDVARRRLELAHRAEFLAQAGVAQVRLAAARQAQFQRSDDPALGFALEDAVAIAERALRVAEPGVVGCHAIVSVHGCDEAADLDAVRADVLDRRGARLAGYQREVLESLQALVERPVHERVPLATGVHVHDRAVTLVTQDMRGVAHEVQQAPVVT